ncbi:MAG: hypothetical protein CM1200mP2_44910 [Planctomycetaceae bacterium]|nr:MAG: hypothetical protein CM1200mP2_44910 [Planctomycetaceae bacterium]
MWKKTSRRPAGTAGPGTAAAAWHPGPWHRGGWRGWQPGRTRGTRAGWFGRALRAGAVPPATVSSSTTRRSGTRWPATRFLAGSCDADRLRPASGHGRVSGPSCPSGYPPHDPVKIRNGASDPRARPPPVPGTGNGKPPGDQHQTVKPVEQSSVPGRVAPTSLTPTSRLIDERVSSPSCRAAGQQPESDQPPGCATGVPANSHLRGR